MALKLLFLRKFSPFDMGYLTEGLCEYYDLIIPDNFSREVLVRSAKDADVFIGNEISRELIDAAVKLKIIQVPGTGIDTLDLRLLRDKNIFVCNSHSNSPYAAEYAIALLFSLLKKIHIHDRFMRDGYWFRPKNNKSDELYLSDSLTGSTLGFLGFGNIAQHIASFLSGFKVEYIAHKKRPDMRQDDAKSSFKINFSGLKPVLSQSDVLFVTLPLTRETRGIISIDELKSMKRTAYLVNVSRGPVINQKSLYEALRKKYIAGAAIDVWYDDVYMDGEKKYPSRRCPFHKLENILLSPHRAGYARNCSPHLIDVIKNLTLFAKENKLMNIVDIKAGY